MSVLPSPAEKAVYVEGMFRRIADRYDEMNRRMTFGLDSAWRVQAVAAIAPPANGYALDLGCGTGDFLPLLAEWMPAGVTVGVDYTLAMMQAGLPRADVQAAGARFVTGDALQLPFADNTFDAITTGFMLRNVTSIPDAFREMLRVTKPGGLMACVEVARPNNVLIRLGHRFYFEQIVPLMARVLGADAQAYAYLPQSARNFPQPAVLAHMLQMAGWDDVNYWLVGFGAAAIHLARKPV